MKALKNLPKRTCIGCNEIKLKKELIRIVKNKEGQISVDKTGKANGRGAYICDNIECLEKAIKTKRLERNFETKISEEIYNELRKRIQ
ncbi:MAG: YlxR family protein [Clostridia bacterium]|nr:YlxR family protein [Clostridia bacterium]